MFISKQKYNYNDYKSGYNLGYKSKTSLIYRICDG